MSSPVFQMDLKMLAARYDSLAHIALADRQIKDIQVEWYYGEDPYYGSLRAQVSYPDAFELMQDVKFPWAAYAGQETVIVDMMSRVDQSVIRNEMFDKWLAITSFYVHDPAGNIMKIRPKRFIIICCMSPYDALMGDPHLCHDLLSTTLRIYRFPTEHIPYAFKRPLEDTNEV